MEPECGFCNWIQVPVLVDVQPPIKIPSSRHALDEVRSRAVNAAAGVNHVLLWIEQVQRDELLPEGAKFAVERFVFDEWDARRSILQASTEMTLERV